MTYFIFAGDMIVMAFMVALVVWVSLGSSAELLDESANIPLGDEVFPGERGGRAENATSDRETCRG